MRRMVWVRDTSGPFDSVRDLWLRSGLSRAAVARLADADAFGSLGLSRRDALWAAEALDAGSAAEHLPLFQAIGAEEARHEAEAALPPMPPGEEVINDYRFLSLSLKGHPVAFVRRGLTERGIRPNAALEETRSGAKVHVAGLVLVRQRPGSAKGVIFMTIEDETGVANIIVWPKVFERLRPVVLGARFVTVTGRMQADHGVIHVVAEEIADLSGLLMRIATGTEALAGATAPADHMRHPLYHRHPRDQVPAALPEDALLPIGEILSHADEVRRPVDLGRLKRQRMERARREAILASHADAVPTEPPTPPGFEPPDRDTRAVLPRGRNFQ